MVNPITYLQEVRQELQRVTWPSQQKTLNMTWLVIGVSAILAMFIAGVDLGFEKMIEWLLS